MVTTANPNNLKGQDYVRWLASEALRQVAINYEGKTSYLDVDLKNQANAETNAMRDYHGRYLFELLQNANDAIIAVQDDPQWSQSAPYRVRIQLTPDALIVANDGVPFLERDVDSIYRWGESSKDPNKSIGYKGIGFKSVLEITQSPEVFSQIVQFRFDRETCYEAVRRIVGRGIELKLPVTRFVFPFTVDSLPQPDRELVKELLEEERFATVIRLPLLAKQEDVLERIEQDVTPTLLLFLNGIEKIEIWRRGKRIRTVHKRVQRAANANCGRNITLYERGKPISRWLLFDAPRRPISDDSILTELRDQAWERVKKVGFAVAFPLDKQGKLLVEVDEPSKLFVYFPSTLKTGLRYLVHGDFYIDAARKQVNNRPYNLWLASEIGRFVRLTVLPELIQRFPQDVRVVQALVPCAERNDFADDLDRALCRELQKCSFVPTVDRVYTEPARVLLPPLGIAEDVTSFYRFFTQAELVRRYRGCRFSIADVERDPLCIDFLLQLGAKRLSFTDAFKLFDGRAPVDDPDDYPALYGFLWTWREELPPQERRRFSQELQKTLCIVIDDGTWIKPHRRLYHAKLRQETPTMPRSIRADLVHPLAYEGTGRAGSTYRLLDSFEPRIREYDAPDIIRNAIIPLFDQDRFRRLSVEERAEVYQYLFEYWRSRRGNDAEVDKIKHKIQVPARLIADRRREEWRTADQVYLSSVWSNDDRLERLYDGFEGIAFLYEIRGLDVKQREREKWFQFWKWLGTETVPRFLVDQVARSVLTWRKWSYIQDNYPHAGSKLWKDYLDEIEAKYAYCPQHGNGYRQLQRSVVLEGFAELIECHQADRFSLLYELLGEDWDRIVKNVPSAQVRCYRSDCRRSTQSATVPSFFEYLVRNAGWIPAHKNLTGTAEYRLYKPAQCWFVSSHEDLVIRNLLPTPFAPDKPGYDQFSRYVGMRSIDRATLYDLVDILRHLPEEYEDPNVAVWSGRTSVPRALAALSRWVFRRMNNLLSEDGSGSPLDQPPPLVARDGDTLRYVYPPEPAFFADNRYHAVRWRQHLPFAPMDDNWQAVSRFLGLKFISECVEEHCTPGAILEAESKRLEMRFKTARPYMLAVVNQQRGSETQDVARYLDNLEITVVESLVVHRRLTTSAEREVVDPEAQVYLEETTTRRTGSAGRAPRAGTLYVCKGFEEHYDLLAGPIAEFIRIPGLADAFVILLDRGGKEGRLRYLSTRGLGDEHVEEMRVTIGQLGLTVEPEPEEQSDELKSHLLKQLAQEAQTARPVESQVETPGPDLLAQEGPQGQSTDHRNVPEPIQFPAVDMSKVATISVDTREIALVVEPASSGRGQGNGGRRTWDWERDQRLRDAYGQRGEQLVRDLEIRRLRELGIEAPEHSLRWLQEQGQPTADHDIESKDWIDGEWVDIVIEVKATPSSDFRFPMSSEELICAQHWQDRYRLYRVINVASPSPQVYVFGNPFKLWQEGKAHIEPRDTYVTLPDPRKNRLEAQATGE